MKVYISVSYTHLYWATPIYKDAYIDFVNEIIKKERIDIVQNEYFEQLYICLLYTSHYDYNHHFIRS